MFPDHTAKWQPHPSALDGIKAPPFVLDRGLWRGVLNLIVLEANPGTRRYGVEIKCEIYGAFDEMIYSMAAEIGSTWYDGNVYLKEAKNSQLIADFARLDPRARRLRHFLFVGSDRCYETLGMGEPKIHFFDSVEDLYAWNPTRVRPQTN